MTSKEFNSQLLSLEPSLMKFAYRFNLKNADAEDLLQDTYLRVLKSREKYLIDSNFKSWTFTIMKNTFVDNYRRNVKIKNSYDQPVESLLNNRAAPAGPESPDSIYSAKEITQNIDQLTDKLRIPFKMYIKGYKYIEIAGELNLKIGTVKKRIFLSRKHLMAQLSR